MVHNTKHGAAIFKENNIKVWNDYSKTVNRQNDNRQTTHLLASRDPLQRRFNLLVLIVSDWLLPYDLCLWPATRARSTFAGTHHVLVPVLQPETVSSVNITHWHSTAWNCEFSYHHTMTINSLKLWVQLTSHIDSQQPETVSSVKITHWQSTVFV